ncbi:MAG: ferrous iron transporter B [bacterium]
MSEIKFADDILELSLKKIGLLLKADYGISKRSIGLLLLQEDAEIISLVKLKDLKNFPKILEIINFTKSNYNDPISYVIALQNQEKANYIIGRAMEYTPAKSIPFREKLSRVMVNPLTGVPIMLLVLYYGIYKFVGEFGAGVLVNFIEKNIFEEILNPFITRIFLQVIPWKVLSDLFVGEYGIITLGVRYAVALILPIVTTFFIIFAIIEDSGYLPRLALLIDRLFKKIGLTGRAVIPIVLGLGCDTMATMVTRTLPTKREKLIATILLALAVPCSAQLGVILSLFDGNPKGLWVWIGVITLVFVFVGFVSSKILPGEGPSFYMEVPPLRLPKLSNVLFKTWTRVKWYFVEILPVFILVSVVIWIGQLTGVFNFLTALLTYPVRWIGLPDQTAVAFLFGFFRRDYGAGGLYDIKKAGLFTGNQLVIACITITLFLPCVAQFLMNIKERGWKMAVGISVFVLFFSFSVGFLVNVVFNTFGVNL